MLVKFAVHGCDDNTILEMEMTEREHEFLKRVSKLSQEVSEYGCQPTIVMHHDV